jgi:dTMP kinase
VPVEQGLSRAGNRGPHEARFENFDAAFHERLRDYFRDLAEREPGRCVLLDGSASPDAVAAAIWDTVAERFGL